MYTKIYSGEIFLKNRCNYEKNKKGDIIKFWKTLMFRLYKEEQNKKVREQRERNRKMRCDRSQESKTKKKFLEESKKLWSVLRH